MQGNASQLALRLYRSLPGDGRELLRTHLSPAFAAFSTTPTAANAATYQFSLVFHLAESADTPATPEVWLTTPGQDPREALLPASGYVPAANGPRPELYPNYTSISFPDRLLDRALPASAGSTTGQSYNEDTPLTDMEGRIIYWSAGAERIYGWQSEEAAGKTVEQLFPEEAVVAKLRKAREITRAQGEWHGQVHLNDRLGKPRIADIRRTLIRDESGRGKAHLSITSDVTEQKRLEEQLARVQRLENIGLLAGGIAHDLNNIVAPMLMVAPVLRGAVKDPGALRMLDLLEQSAERGTALIRQIQAFAHGAGGETQLVQVRQLLRDIGLFVAETFPKNIRVEERVPADLWPVKANPSQLHQVLLNLSLNARDAMTAGGQLTVRAENCTLDEIAAGVIEGGRAGRFVMLQIEDTGTGIAPEVLAHMWEPFVTTKGAGKGTGLGLSTVRGIVNTHAGFIQLDTTRGKGTSFRVYLPAAPANEATPGLSASGVPHGHGELILVVDDEPPIREMISKMLTRYGYRVLTASDGAEATAFFAKHSNEVRLVVSDLNMPNLDGAMLAQVLKRMNPDVRVLIVSGLAAPAEGRPAFRPEEFTGLFLKKPFKSDDLLRKVTELIQRPAVAPKPAV